MLKIKFLVIDVDGTLTDGKIYMGCQGEVCKAFHVRDGYGILHLAMPNAIVPVILTGRESRIVENRCKELGITEIYQGVSDKLSKLRQIAEDFSQVAYMGDDLNDLACMQAVKAEGGLTGCPRDAAKEIIAVADCVTEHRGGEGAVRDFIEWLLSYPKIK